MPSCCHEGQAKARGVWGRRLALGVDWTAAAMRVHDAMHDLMLEAILRHAAGYNHDQAWGCLLVCCSGPAAVALLGDSYEDRARLFHAVLGS